MTSGGEGGTGGPSDGGPGIGGPDAARADIGALRRELAGAPGGSRLSPLGLGQVVTGAGAADGLAEVAAGLGRPGGEVVVLAAATPMSAGGRDLRAVVEAALGASFTVRWVVVGPAAPAGGLVHADEPTVAAAAAAAAGADCVVTVGSGTVTDIGKADRKSVV